MRNTNIEFLRIVLMAMIVLGHVIIHGMENWELLSALSPIICIHVPCFIFISGYFGIQFKIKSFITLLIKILLYSSISLLCSIFLFHTTPSLTVYHIFLLLTFENGLWFMNCYLFLYLIAQFIHVKSTQSLQILLLLFVFVSLFQYANGLDNNRFLLFVFMYVLGRYLSTFKFVLSTKASLGLFLCSLGASYISYIFLFRDHISYSISYFNPFFIVSSILLFYVFKSLKIRQSTAINSVASGVLATYLVTDTNWNRGNFEKVIIEGCNNNIMLIIVAVVLFVVLMGFIDYNIGKIIKSILK